VSSGGSPFADTILSYASDRGVDLIVIGAYSHARTIEMVFGGVTRTLLKQAPVPVLMSRRASYHLTAEIRLSGAVDWSGLMRCGVHREQTRPVRKRGCHVCFTRTFEITRFKSGSRKFERQARRAHWRSAKTISTSQVQLRPGFANGGCGHGVALAGGCERLNETEVDYAVDIFVFVVDQSGRPMVQLAEPPCRSGVADVVVGDNANPSRRH
jgi:Universal stress protein family